MCKTELTVLAGGVGAARFLSGLVHVMPPETITVIVNTADDLTSYGLFISPDIDIITYTLAGIVNPERGWGVADDSFHCLSMLDTLGHSTWFNLGDKDLGTHIHRTFRLQQGWTLDQITEEIRIALNVKSKVIPMTNQRVMTKINTSTDILPFQEYFVKRNFLLIKKLPIIIPSMADAMYTIIPLPTVIFAYSIKKIRIQTNIPSCKI